MNEAQQEQLAYLLGAMTTQLALVGLLMAFGYFVGKSLGRDRVPQVVVKWPIYGAMVVGLGWVVITLPSTLSSSHGDSVPVTEVRVVDGAAAASMPESIEPQALEEARAKIIQNLESDTSFSQQFGRHTSDIAAVKFSGDTVVRFEMVGSTGVRFTMYEGVVNRRVKAVHCVTVGAEHDSSCIDRATSIFGSSEPATAETDKNG